MIISRLIDDKNENDRLGNVNVESEQLSMGRNWILYYINNIKENQISFEMLFNLNNIRACLMLCNNQEETNLLWTQLNERI